MNYAKLFKVVKIFEFTNSIVCLILDAILVDALSQYKSKYKESLSTENSHTVFTGIFGFIILINVPISGFYCFAFDKIKKSDIGIHCVVCVLWILYALTKMYYYASIHLSDYNNTYDPSLVSLVTHMSYNTYITTISLGWINSMLYFISAIFFWKLWRNVGGKNKDRKANNSDLVVNMEYIDEMDDSTVTVDSGNSGVNLDGNASDNRLLRL